MKKAIVFCSLMGAGTLCFAAGAVFEQPVNNQGTAGCISVSSRTWTAVPTSALGPRVGLYVTVVTTAAANMAAHVGTTDTPTLGLTVWPIILKPGLTQYHGLSSVSIFYLLAGPSATVQNETACYQEVRQ